MIQQPIKDFIRRLEANEKSPHTISSYNRDLLNFAKALSDIHPDLDIDAITPPVLDEVFTARSM